MIKFFKKHIILITIITIITSISIIQLITARNLSKNSCYTLGPNSHSSLQRALDLGALTLDTLVVEQLSVEDQKVKEEFLILRAKILKELSPKLNKEPHKTRSFNLTFTENTRRYYILGTKLLSLPSSQENNSNKRKKQSRKTIPLEEIRKQWLLQSNTVKFERCP